MDFFLDRPLYFGSPWHGRLNGTTLTLPNATTRTQPGDAVDGGDFFAVKKPGQPAVTTTADEAAQGKQWLNYGIISGKNHVFYGKALGARSWLYIDGDGDVWLVSVDFPSATATITFKRFGQLGEPPAAVAQTISITPGWTTVKALHVIQDITPTGNKVVWSHRDALETAPTGSRAAVTVLQGATLFQISGKPPAASVSWTVARTEADCRGTLTDTMTSNYRGFYSRTPEGQSSPITHHDYTVTWATNGTQPSLAPPIPSGFQQFGLSSGVMTSRTGEKKLAGATVGAIFDAAGVVQWVTVDASITDADTATYNPVSTAPYGVVDVDLQSGTGSRSGGVTLKVGGVVVSSIPVSITATSGSAVSTSLSAALGSFYTETNPAISGLHQTNGINFDVTDQRIMFRVPPVMLGTNTSARFFPSRFSNLCYGILTVAGKYPEITAGYTEDALGSVAERAEVISITTGAHVVSDPVSGVAAVQNIFASCNRETGALAVSLTENVAYV